MKRHSIILLLASMTLVCACGNRNSSEVKPRYVKCDTVKVASEYVDLSEFPGRVKASSEGNISFRIAGPIERINVKEGQKVYKGQVLAQLEQRDYLIQLNATQAEYDGIKVQADRATKLHENKVISDADYDKAVYGLKQITEKLNAHKNALEDTRLRAPYSGYIDKINFKTGETVAAGMPVVSMMSSSTPEVEINIPAADFVRRDQISKAYCTIDVLDGKEFELEPITMNMKANLNQLYTSRFRIKGSENLPSPGMSANVRIYYNTDGETMMSIPVSALISGEDGTSVWVVEDGKVSSRKVQISKISLDGKAYVASGLEEGDIIVVAGTTALREGQNVRI